MTDLVFKKCPKARKRTGKKAKPQVPHGPYTWIAGVNYTYGDIDGYVAHCPGWKP